MKIFSVVALLLISSLTFFAQHDHKGCHHYRSSVNQAEVTDAQKMMIMDSNARSDTFNIMHYDIHLDVTDYNGQIIIGYTEVTFEPILANQNSVNFDLFELEIDSVINENGLLNYNYNGELLNVEFDETPLIGEILNVKVYYHGTPHRDPSWGGFYFESDYIYNLGIGLTSIPPNFGKVWYPCFDSFVERATYSYYITSADGKLAHCQGNLIEETIISGDTTERHYDFLYEITTHQSAIAVSDYQTHAYDHEGEYGVIPVTLKARPAQFDAMDDIFVELGFAIDALEYWYGPYPFDRVGYIMTTDGALEIPENIAYPASMTGASIFNNGQLFAHELGHQWWGNVVTPRLHNHMWIKEGPAEYSGHLFIEFMDGDEAFREIVKDNLQFVLEEAHIQDDGFWQLSPIPDEHIYGRHTYYKGAAMMHNMRAYLGDDLFRQAMMTVQEDNAYTSVDAEEFEQVLEDATGADLGDFFQNWILTPGFSTFVVDSVITVELDGVFTSQVYLQQKLREAPAFHSNVPIQISVLNADWEYEQFDFVADGEFSDFEFSTSYDPVMVVFDSNHKLNGARLEYETVLISDEFFNQNLPWVEFGLKKNDLPEGEDAFIRVEHIWSAPDAEYTHPAIEEMSSTHYWIVDGDWPEGTDLEARVNYLGTDSDELDYDLVGSTEADLMLVYREHSSDQWIVYPDYTWFSGSLSSGNGNIRIDILKKGQYAFANGDVTLSVPDLNLEFVSMEIYPNPTNEFLNIKIDEDLGSEFLAEVYDQSGKLIFLENITSQGQIKTADLSPGSYVLILNVDGERIDSKPFEVIR